MIENIHYRGRDLRFATENSRKFDRYFPFGSLNLLIGVNGSGKTTMLLQAAKILSAGADFGDEGNYSFIDNNGVSIVRDTRYRPQGYGVVYYTPLPYRRPLQANRYLVDASADHSRSKDSISIRHFREMSRLLGQETQLIGKVTYRHDIVEKLFLPFMIESKLELRDEELNQLLIELREVRTSNTANRIASGLETEQSRTKLEDISKEKDLLIKLTNEFSRLLFYTLDREGRFYRTASLASLQKIYILVKNKRQLIHYFLEISELVKPLNAWSKDASRFSQMRDTTFRYLLNENSDIYNIKEISESEIQFGIASDTVYTMLVISDTAIELGWSDLSSGLQALIDQFSRIESAVGRLADRKIHKVILLIDEGDAFLHLDWQRKYIYLLSVFLLNVKKRFDLISLQVLIASHSPILAGDVPRCMVQNIDHPESSPKTFGAALDDIVLQCFHSNSVGEFAALMIRALYERARSKRLTPTDYALIEEIGDPALRTAILEAGGDSNHGG